MGKTDTATSPPNYELTPTFIKMYIKLNPRRSKSLNKQKIKIIIYKLDEINKSFIDKNKKINQKNNETG